MQLITGLVNAPLNVDKMEISLSTEQDLSSSELFFSNLIDVSNHIQALSGGVLLPHYGNLVSDSILQEISKNISFPNKINLEEVERLGVQADQLSNTLLNINTQDGLDYDALSNIDVILNNIASILSGESASNNSISAPIISTEMPNIDRLALNNKADSLGGEYQEVLSISSSGNNEKIKLFGLNELSDKLSALINFNDNNVAKEGIQLQSLSTSSPEQAFSHIQPLSTAQSGRSVLTLEPIISNQINVSSDIGIGRIGYDLSTSEWSQDFTNKVIWTLQTHSGKARMILTPPELGPVDIQIDVQGEKASIVFNSHHSSVRDSIEQSLIRLKEMLADQGVNLVDVDVSDQSSNFRQDDSKGSFGSDENTEGNDDIEKVQSILNKGEMVLRGLVDYYA